MNNNITYSCSLDLRNGGIPKSSRMFSRAINSKCFSTDSANELYKTISNLICCKYNPRKIITCHGLYRIHVIFALLDKLFKGGSIIFVPHGALDSYLLEKDGILKKLYLFSFFYFFSLFVNKIVFSTNLEREKANKLVPFIFKINQKTIHWGIEPKINYTVDKRSQSREKLNIDKSTQVFISYGRLCHMKNFIKTVELFSILNKELKYKSILIIFGTPDEISTSDLRKKTIELGIQDYVFIDGYIDINKDRTFLYASDIYLSLSERENFNRSLVECLICGCSAIVSPGHDIIGDIKDNTPIYAKTDLNTADIYKITKWCERQYLKDIDHRYNISVKIKNRFSFECFSKSLNDFLFT